MESVLKQTQFSTGTNVDRQTFYQSESEGVRSSVNMFQTFDHSQDQKHQLMAQCEELLIDEHGHYWFIEMNTKRHASSKVFLYAENGELLQHYVFNGKTTLYEFSDYVLAACEGNDYKGYIYKINKHTYQVQKYWVVFGFLWDVSMHGDSVYATTYLPDRDEALIYRLNGNTVVTQSLGYGFYPASLVKCGQHFYLGTNYPFSSKKGTVMTLSLTGMKLGECDTGLSIRELFSYENDLVLHGIDYSTGTAETLTYVNKCTNETTTYQIPKVTDIKQHGSQLILINRKLKTMMYWSLKGRKLTRVVKWSGLNQLPVFHTPAINI